jgi:hypothetical protein
MTIPFTDQTQRDYLHEQDAADRAAHLKLVHSAAVGGDEASDSEVRKLAVDFADTTDACNFILARYAATSKKFYGPSKRVRDFLCAVIGATGGSPEYVEVTDDDLAARMACSGIFEFAKKTAEAGNDLYNFYQRTNIGVETLSALRVALQSTGRDLGSFQNSLVFFQRNVEKVVELTAAHKDKNNDLAKSFKALDIDVSSNEKALLSAFAALSKLPEGYQQTALAQRLFRGGAKDVLAESHGDFDAYTERLRKMGLIIGTDAARQAHDFNVQLQLLRLEAETAGRILGQEVLPTITGAIEDMTGAMSGNQSVLKSWGEGLRDVVQLIETLAATFKKDENSTAWETPADTARRFMANKERIQRRDDIASGRITVTPDEMTPAQRAERQKKGNRELYNAQVNAGMKPDADMRNRARGDIDPADLTGAKKGGADKAAQEAERVIKESLHAIEEEYSRHVEALRRDFDNEVISSQAYTKGIVDEANDRFEKLKAGLEREKALQKKQSGKDRVDNEIQRARQDY